MPHAVWDTRHPQIMPKLLWTARTGFGPAPRSGHAMAYDSARKRAVLMGGGSGAGLFDDTWEWDGRYWTQVADIGPAARTDLALAFDSTRMRTILFGGAGADGSPLGDTWEWDGDYWTQLTDAGPPARSAHALSFDASRRRVVLFGGRSADGRTLADTWEFDGEDWTEVEDTGPAGRAFHSLVFSEAERQVVLFGGTNEDGGDLGDTWAWNGRDWRQGATFGPAARRRAAAIGTHDLIVLFGGAARGAAGAADVVLRDTWGFDGLRWTQLQDIGPAARSGHAMAFDADRAKAVMFGGLGPSVSGNGGPPRLFGDTWEHPAMRRAGSPQDPDMPPDPNPPQMIVQGLVLTPATAGAGQSVTATIHVVSGLVSHQVIVVYVPQQDLDQFVQHGGDPTVLFESGELLTVVQIPAQVTVVTGTFTAPPLPGAYGILAGTHPALYAYGSLQVV